MCRTLPILFASTLAALAQAGVHDFALWFDTPETVNAGETFTVDVWARYSGPFQDSPPGAYSGYNFSLDIESMAGGAISSVAFDPTLVFLDGLGGSGELTTDGDLVNIAGGNIFGILPTVFGNELRLFSVLVTAGDAENALSIVIAQSNPTGTVEWLSDTSSGDAITILDTDPDASLTLTPATIRVIPAPASATLVIAGLACRRRRRATCRAQSRNVRRAH